MSPADSPLSGRPTRAEIDLGAFQSNLRLAAFLGGDRREVMAVVKADAYGHGAVPLAGAALRAGASILGVATLEEACRLRVAGIEAPICILSEVLPGAAAEVVALRCTQVLYTLELAEALERAAAFAGTRVPIHLKIDTGMGRVGIPPSAAVDLSARLRKMPHLLLEGVLSHLAEADIPDRDTTLRQLGEFSSLCRRLEKDCPELRYRHIANSALLLSGSATGDITRPGIMLYGSPPAPGFPGTEGLRPVMRFLTGLAFLKKVPPGTPLSYGGTHVTRRESLIATLPVGYADGYARRLSNRVNVLVGGRRVPQVGTICMDMCLVDVTDVPGAAVGDEAVLIGKQGEEEITVGELAELLDTITYEITCAVSDRVPRVHLGGETPGAATPEAGRE
jgi:alanine racemase